MIAINENWKRAEFLASRATDIACNPADVETVCALVREAGLQDRITVRETPLLPPGRYYAIDRTALDAISKLAWGPMSIEPIPPALQDDDFPAVSGLDATERRATLLDGEHAWQHAWQCGCDSEPWVADGAACPECGYNPDDEVGPYGGEEEGTVEG